MKFLITSDCFRSAGRLLSAGTVVDDLTKDEERDLSAAGRGHVVPDDYTAEPTKADAPAKGKK